MNNDIQRLSSTVRSEVINALITTLNTHYIFPEAAEEVAFMLHLRQSRGEYDALDEGKPFAEALTTHMREVSNDAHLAVFYEPQQATRVQNTEFLASRRDVGATLNYGFEKVERLVGNIGLLCLSTFFSPTFAFHAVITAMDFIAHTNALIIDLRAASGGDLTMLKFFASYFFGSDPVHLNDIYWRSQNIVQEYWTLPYIPGQRYMEKPVSILTSHSTSAVAEALAYALQSEKRATIVGESTAGEANPLECLPLCAQFASWIPVGQITDPLTGTNWEGVGVRPDIEATRKDALKSAYTLALSYVLERNGHLENPALEREIRDVLAQQS